MENKENILLLTSKIYSPIPYSIWNDYKRLKYFFGIPILLICFMMILNNKFNNVYTGIVLILFLIPWVILHFRKLGTNYTSDLSEENIKFTNNEIIILEDAIELEKIKSIQLNLNDYEGKSIYRSNNDFTPIFSQGFDNSIELESINGKEYRIKFQLKGRKEKLKLMPMIFELIQLQKITESDGMELLNLSQREEELYTLELEQLKKDTIDNKL